MRVAIDVRSLEIHRTRGLGCYARNLINSISQIDSENEYLLFYCRGIKRGNLEVGDNFKKWEVLLKRPKRLYRLDTIMDQSLLPTEILLNGRIDVFHSLSSVIPYLKICKFVVTVPDLIPFVLNEKKIDKLLLNLRFREWLWMKSLRKADRIITFSENSKKDIIELLGIPEEKIEVIYLSADARFGPVRDRQAIAKIMGRYSVNQKFVLYVGGFAEHKNIERLVRTFYEFSLSSDDKWQFVLAGKLPDEKIEDADDWTINEPVRKTKSLITKLGLDAKVIFTGFVPEQDLPALYSAASVFVFPSLYEGFGLPPLEAMACGTPVVASNTSSLPEVIGDAGVLVNPFSIDEIVGAMRSVLKSKSRQREMSYKGMERARRFSWEETARKTLKVYRQVREGNRHVGD